jgi:hypothetical protein
VAKIVEELVVIKFSSIVKDRSGEQSTVLSDEVMTALEQVAQELADTLSGASVVVEVERA